jgi:hypothetical protein
LCVPAYATELLLTHPLQAYPEEFAIIFAQALVTNQVTIEHDYASTLMHTPNSRQWCLLENYPMKDWTRESFLEDRREMIDGE